MKKIIALLILFLLCGCSYHEINEYAIVSGISIDKRDNKYIVGIQIMNAKKDKETDNSIISFYKEEGKSINECLDKIMLTSPKELYLGHNEVIIISDGLLKKENPLNYLDFFMRDSRVEKDSLIIASKENSAYDILKIITPLETIPTKNIKSTLVVSDKYTNLVNKITLDEFVSNLLYKRDFALPSISIEGDVSKGNDMDNIKSSMPDTDLSFKTLAYFKKGRLNGYLNEDESIGYNVLSNNIKGGFLDVKCDKNNYLTIKIENTKFKDSLYFKDNTAVVDIDIKLYVKLVEYNCKGNLMDDTVVKDIQNKTNKKITKLSNSLIEKAYKNNKADILKYVFKFKKIKYDEIIKKHYSDDYIKNNIRFNIKVKSFINSPGLSIKSIKETKDE